MELSDKIEKFMLNIKNSEIILDLTKLSADYFLKVVSKNLSYNVLKDYLSKIEELKEENPDAVAVELIKYLYEHRNN